MKYKLQFKKKNMFNIKNFHRRKKLISHWKKTQNFNQNSITTISYTNVTAFKFPDKQQVFLTCNVEVSKVKYCNSF